MSRQLTNNKNISLALAVWLSLDEYDHNPNPNHISVTSLIKPIKQLVLSRRVDEKSTDISQLVNSRMGTAIHNSCEQAWYDEENVKKAFLMSGLPKRVAESVVVNPEHEFEGIPVYLEQRVSKKFGKWEISGKFDIVIDGAIADFKSTSVWTFIDQRTAEKYVLQASIYRYLNPEKITEDFMEIHYIFTDWSFASSKSNKDYPPERVHTQRFTLMSLQETENYIKRKITEIERYDTAEQGTIPNCTSEDLWRSPPKFKYYKNPENTTRATRNFDTLLEANQYKASTGKGVGIVLEVKSKAKACNYCDARAICIQAKQLEEAGDL